MTPADHLRTLAMRKRDDSVRRAARRNPSLPDDLFESLLNAGDLDVWASPQLPLWLLVHGRSGTVTNGMSQAILACYRAPRPDLRAELQATLVPLYQEWWEQADAKGLILHLTEFESDYQPGPRGERYLLPLRLILPFVREQMPTLGPDASIVEEYLAPIEAWIAQPETPFPEEVSTALEEHVERLQDIADEESEQGYRLRKMLLAVEALTYHDPVQTLSNAAYEERLSVDEEKRLLARLADDFRASLGVCPLPGGLTG